MRTFRIYKHPTNGYKAIKAGFSWPALLLTFIWLFATGLWGLAILWLVIPIGHFIFDMMAYYALDGLALDLSYVFGYALDLALFIVPAWYGNRWREARLLKRGYELLGTVRAKWPHEAVEKSRQGEYELKTDTMDKQVG